MGRKAIRSWVMGLEEEGVGGSPRGKGLILHTDRELPAGVSGGRGEDVLATTSGS